MIFTARNTHRAYIITKTNGNMSSNFVSDIADFKEMSIGSVQVKWDGNDAEDGQIILQASNVPDDEWFDDMECADVVLDDDNSQFGKKKTKVFNLGLIGYRYVRLRYLKGSNTTGTIQAFAIGKKNG